MVQGVSEIAAVCAGLFGLIGAAATTGLPMWKVTAFIGENIIVMETRWEGLWMNCYRQANIRMQCKMYDSLLFLPPELQAARGLMCSSVALSGLGLFVALAGMQCTSCFQSNPRSKTLMLMVAGVMELMACICVFIPVSWTGNVIIRDFYNPLLINAQKRELGDALYIGWVTGAFLLASSMLFLCRHLPPDNNVFNVYHGHNLLHYKPGPRKPTAMTYHPISNVSSLRSTATQPPLQSNGSVGQQALPLQNLPQVMTNDGVLIKSPVYNPTLHENLLVSHQGSTGPYSSAQSFRHGGSLHTLPNSLYMSENSTPLTYAGNHTESYQSSFHPVPHTPVFIQYKSSRIQAYSDSGSSGGVYI
ncbi:claudin-8-like [Channa argus]|uniref:claudin-8-like n=1 Tax=Channa argus TaxID=215402 RepID=UPI00351F9917